MDIKNQTIELIDNLKAVCQRFGLGNDGNEYKVITQVFLYKFLVDKFGYELKKLGIKESQKLFEKENKWENEYAKLSESELALIRAMLPAEVPDLSPNELLSNLWNSQGKPNFGEIFDDTMVEIAQKNIGIFYTKTESTKLPIFEKLTPYVTDEGRRAEFARALVDKLVKFSFESAFKEHYDFFSDIFEYLIKDYNTAGGGKYAEYYTPKAIAKIMAQLLVGDAKNLKSVECYDPSAGTGTLLMALSHQIGEERTTIYSQDISQRSNKMLKLNLLLNGLVSSLDHSVQGDTLLNPYHKEVNKKGEESLKQFDFVVSNPPFKMDFSETRDALEHKWGPRFWAGVPNVPAKKKESMAIYTCFIQHVINSLKETGRGAIVIPTGFITAKSGIEKKILTRIVDEKIVYGCVSMPSNVFANTGTNVSVLFFDKSAKAEKVILIDASKLGKEYKDANGLKKVRLGEDEIKKIVETFRNKTAVEDFSVTVTYDQIKEKGYSLSAGQYFDIKIDYVDITPEEFNSRMQTFEKSLKEQFAQSKKLEDEILENLKKLKFGENMEP